MRRRLSAIQRAAVVAMLGALFGELTPVSPLCATLVCGTAAAGVMVSQRSVLRRNVALALLLLTLIAGRAQWLRWDYQCCDLTDGHAVGDQLLLTGRVASVPVLSVRPTSRFSPSAFGNPATTRFLLDVSSQQADGRRHAVSGRCSVYVDGNVASLLRGGDVVQLSGELSWPHAPRNPGEFDFAAHLRRQRISSLVYVNHPDAVMVVERAFWWQPLRLASAMRQQFRHVITSSVSPELSAVALALLLGNRYQLDGETQDAFVASGAMHLLAISGLHVGILFGVLVRVANWLFATRRQSLLAAVLICLAYAFVTDLKPSVIRAVAFCAVFSCSQLLGRSTSLGDVIAVTALGMLAYEPAIVFSCGAWLSFLSVTALALSPRTSAGWWSQPPAIPVTVWERMSAVVRVGVKRMAVRFGQMTMILIFTLPLAAVFFHAIAPIGFLVNLLLIASAGWGLWTGFVLLLTGSLFPPTAPSAGMVFSGVLHVMASLVKWAGGLWWGHFYVFDLPIWFPAVWYACLAVVVAQPGRVVRGIMLVTMLAAAIGAGAQHAGRTWPVRCTVLSVGHGSCAVLEAGDGRVFVVDAGAMNRGQRVSRTLCGFLWQAGYRQIDGVVISHADTDHINGLAGLLRKFPVRRLLTTREVLNADSQAVTSLLQLAGSRQIAQVTVEDGDRVAVGRLVLELYQARGRHRTSDDAASLVVAVQGPEAKVLLPADLEGPGALDVYRRVGPVDVLISAHHGSPSTNDRLVARALRPDLVVVSGRDFSHRLPLECAYAGSRQVVFTASGAVSVALNERHPRCAVFPRTAANPADGD
ncbi:MAG: ComEC/Rec2 family competence protein [Planctomycetaceae bacterium]|nr:ComEC/Rec2 family competence protein [Planctomycetaceae bacterium]